MAKQEEQESPETKHEKVRKYWEGFPEAPYSDTFKWVDPLGFEHMTTVRAWSDQGLLTGVSKIRAEIVDAFGEPYGKPKQAPVATIEEKDEQGVPVIDAQTGETRKIELPAGTKLYEIKSVFRDKTKANEKNPNGLDVLHVVTVETPYNTKYGVTCFHPNDPAFDGWKTWPLGERYAAKVKHVIIRDPSEQNKYAEVLEFRE